MKTGNVIKTPYNSIVIVTSVTDDYVDWVSFDAENSSGGGKLKDYERDESCFCCEGNDGEYDECCEDCKGTGSYKRTIIGLEKSKVLASNVKEYILKGLVKNFEGLKYW